MLACQEKTLVGQASHFNADLSLIYALWSGSTETDRMMRASDHLAIRKAAAGVSRISGALYTHLSSRGAADQRTLPSIKPTTRVRHTPTRFWLEFKLDGFEADWSESTVLFVEFGIHSVTLGVRLPTVGSSAFAQTNLEQMLANLNTQQPKHNWRFAHLEAPGNESQCSRDVNTWLGLRFEAIASESNNLTICRTVSGTRPSYEDIATGMADAADQVGALLCKRTPKFLSLVD
jgi:hypothetical protein